MGGWVGGWVGVNLLLEKPIWNLARVNCAACDQRTLGAAAARHQQHDPARHVPIPLQPPSRAPHTHTHTHTCATFSLCSLTHTCARAQALELEEGAARDILSRAQVVAATCIGAGEARLQVCAVWGVRCGVVVVRGCKYQPKINQTKPN